MASSPAGKTLKERPVGLVLAGGAGRRLGGRDKGLLAYGDGPAAKHAVATLARLCGPVFVSANRNLDAYERLAPGRVLRDRRAGYPGPLAAIEALSRVGVEGDVLVLPCDMPGVLPGVYEELLRVLDSEPALDATYAATSERTHFLVTALRGRVLAGVTPQLDRGQRTVRTWLATLRARPVRFAGSEADSLHNRNTPQDWVKPDGD
jgi:molybdopterin-guanine dinucleotide biosynthesis protein A